MWQIHRGKFDADEPAYHVLTHLIGPGDVVVDVGANVGRYTIQMARLVGPSGHVIAIEPVPETAEVLLANVRSADLHQVTIVQAAVSDRIAVAQLRIPIQDTGFAAHYFAHLVDVEDQPSHEVIPVLCCTVDSLVGKLPVKLVKIDVEKHEDRALHGMSRTLSDTRPFVVIEPSERNTYELFKAFDYDGRCLAGSQDWLFWPREQSSLASEALARLGIGS